MMDGVKNISNRHKTGQLEIPYLNFFGETPFDLEITYGNIPETIGQPYQSTPFYKISGSEFILSVPGIADYYVSKGKQIIINRKAGTTENEVLLFLMDSVFSVLIYQQGLMSFHGMAIEKDGLAHVFAGSPGAGKSVLAYELLKTEKYRLISDGQIFSDGKVVFSGFHNITLWQDMIEFYDLSSEELIRARPALNKYWFQADNYTMDHAYPIAAIWIMPRVRNETYEIKDLKGKQKLKRLWDIRSWKKLAELMNYKKDIFGQYVQMANTLSIKEVSFYHDFGKNMNPQKLASMIKNELDQWKKK
ncbi:MAG: hypothetical protein K9H84_04955 [Bacteroidales bacterium]|nr:hypothetical protein [Bacteroidales bacterium]